MKVYACPAEVPFEIDYSNLDWNKMNADEEAHTAALIAHLRANGYNGPLTGGTLAMPMADGAARYMYADAGAKSCLIHLPYGDAWHHRDAEFLPKKEVIKRVEENRKRSEFFKQREAAKVTA